MRNASCQPADGFEPLQLLDFLFQAFAFSPLLCFMKLPVNGGKQARQIVFHDVVLSALFQRGHGRFFPDGAGDKNKREFQTFCPQQFQRLRSREVRHGVIADDQVPLLLSQGRLHTGRAIHSFIWQPRHDSWPPSRLLAPFGSREWHVLQANCVCSGILCEKAANVLLETRAGTGSGRSADVIAGCNR